MSHIRPYKQSKVCRFVISIVGVGYSSKRVVYISKPGVLPGAGIGCKSMYGTIVSSINY